MMKNNGYLFSYESKFGKVGKKKYLEQDFEWDTSKLKKVTWWTRLSTSIWLMFHTKK